MRESRKQFLQKPPSEILAEMQYLHLLLFTAWEDRGETWSWMQNDVPCLHSELGINIKL